jgi:acetylornithine deacetylase/succinyl-diaminopimelate desuccinylase-like protein
MSHQTDEYCPVENITRVKALYRKIIEDWGTRFASR